MAGFQSGMGYPAVSDCPVKELLANLGAGHEAAGFEFLEDFPVLLGAGILHATSKKTDFLSPPRASWRVLEALVSNFCLVANP